MANIAKLLTEHMAIWTAAESEKKSGRGRASGNAGSVYGVKKLRELILELAVRGKLVPQDPNDEPASELLKRIQAEKAKLIAEGKLKKEKPFTAVSRDEIPYEIPANWKWIKVGECLNQISNGYTGAQSKTITDFPITRIETISKAEIDMSKVGYCQNITNEEVEKYKMDNGDILMSHINSDYHLGKTAVYETNNLLIHGTNLLLLRPSKNISYKFLHTYLTQRRLSGYFFGIAQHAIGQSSINQTKVSQTLIALPPLNEQHRIVAKVDELMALCDQLEQQHSNAQEAHETLVNQLLATLTQSQNAAEFSANWQRIYAHFDVLFTTEASIDALKQTLLQLAVMGKLVPQNPNDEPASELLKRIQAEKTKLIAEGKLKKEKPLAPIGEDEKPYKTPLGWSWVRLNELLTKIGAGSTPLGGKQVYVNDGIPFLRSQNVWDEGLRLDDVAYITIDTHKKMLGTHVKSGDLLFNITGASIGRCAIVPEGFSTGNVSQHVTIIRLASTEILRFMHLVMTSKHVQQTVMDVQVGVSREGLSIGKLGKFVIPIPPIAEQKRIVAKVDALMELCNQLKTRIQQANHQQQAIADALVAQALKPATAKIIDLAAYRAAITCNIIKRMQHNQAFGRTFAMKLLYLSQQHIGFETHLEFEREAAGPFDKWIYDFERDGIAAGWFGRVEKQLANGHTKIEYQVKSAIEEPVAFMNRVGSTEQRKELDRLFALFADKKTEDAEIVATLFAVWNDFLLGGMSPADEKIIQEVRENWHTSKARFSPEQLKQWLDWLRDNNIVPTGKGCKTIYQKDLIY